MIYRDIILGSVTLIERMKIGKLSFVVKKNQIVGNGGGCDTCCVVCQLYACFFFQTLFVCHLKTNVSAIPLQQFILLLAVIISSVSMNMFVQLGFNIDFQFP